MNHVSASPTNGNGPTQGQRKTLTRVGIEPTTVGLVRSPSLYQMSYKVRREQAWVALGERLSVKEQNFRCFGPAKKKKEIIVV